VLDWLIRGELWVGLRYHSLSGFAHGTSTPSPMNETLALVTPVAAAGYSLLYLLFGGGIFGAIVIFIVAKIFRK